jgi:uncharacterized protein (DUF2249 family)
MITSATTIGQLLEEHPELVAFLASYHPHFEKLRFGLLRKVMAPRVTVEQAARMAGISPRELLGALRRAVGEPEPAEPEAVNPSGVDVPSARPAALAARRAVHLDVRDDIRRGGEPFARIMGAVKALGADEALALRTPFEPIPLYDVLRRRGLAHWAERHAPDDWSVWFYGEPQPSPESATAAPSGGAAGAILDVRGLEPPLPMVRVLERIDTLADDERLEVIHDRRPMFLYPQLEERGFAHETDEPEPGVVRIRISKRPRPPR